jgi:hypothetical protein
MVLRKCSDGRQERILDTQNVLIMSKGLKGRWAGYSNLVIQNVDVGVALRH